MEKKVLTQTKVKSWTRWMGAAFLGLFVVAQMPNVLFAEQKGNPPGPKGSPGAGPAWQKFKGSNLPGPIGGPGRGPAWKNPPGPKGGPGAGPAWHKYKKFPPQKRYEAAHKTLERLNTKRERLATRGASEEKLAKVDQKIQGLQGKIQKYEEKHPKAASTGTGSEKATTTTESSAKESTS